MLVVMARSGAIPKQAACTACMKMQSEMEAMLQQQGAMAARLTAAKRALEAQADGARDTDQAVGYLQRQLAEHRAQHMRLAEDLARVRAALGSLANVGSLLQARLHVAPCVNMCIQG